MWVCSTAKKTALIYSSHAILASDVTVVSVLGAMRFRKVPVLQKELVRIEPLKSINDAWHPVIVFTYCLGATVLAIIQKVVTICPLKVDNFDQLSDDIGGLFLRRLEQLNLLVTTYIGWTRTCLRCVPQKRHMVSFFRALRYFHTMVVMSRSLRSLFIHFFAYVGYDTSICWLL